MNPIIETEHKIKKVKNGILHFGEVYLKIEFTKKKALVVEENFTEKIPNLNQGQVFSIPQQGFISWKKGIHNGIEYAYSKIDEKRGIKVIIENAKGLGTDTNPTILGFCAYKAILKKVSNSETEMDSKKIEEFVFSSWSYGFDYIPDFNIMD